MSNFKKTKVAKIASGVVGALTALAMAGGVAVLPAFAADDVAAQIAALMAQIQVLQAKLAASQTVAAVGSYTFSTNLTIGSKGVDVMHLQQVLNNDADTVVALTGAGSKGNETQYFGSATKAAVIKFQAKHGISPAAGYVGSITRAKLNGMVATTQTTTTTTTTTTTAAAGTLVVTASPIQPSNALFPKSTSRVPFTKVVLTAGSSDVTINGVVVERTGTSVDASIAGVVLLDENGSQLGVAKTLNSVHRATVGDPLTIKAGTSRTLTIAGNGNSDNSSYAGTLISLDVVGINTTATLAGDILPIRGATHTINNTLTTGTATAIISSYDPAATASKEIGTVNYKFSGIRVTAGSAEKTILKSVRWYQSGSVSSNDLTNIKVVVVDGGIATYDTTISADGKYYTALFGEGVLIDKGMSKDIYIQGDIIGTGAAGRTIDFDIYKDTDVYLLGETYGYGIIASGSGGRFSTSNPFYNGYAVTVTAGSASTISKAVSVPAQSIAVNVPNQILGGFDVDLKGEPITVQSMVFNIASSSGSGYGLLTNVSLVDQNGAIVAGPIDATYVDGTVGQRVTFTDSVTFPIGVSTWVLKGKVPSTVGNDTAYVVSTTPSTNWTNITGQVTGNTISLSSFSTAITMNTMTVKAAALAVAVSTDIPAQTIVAGGQKVLFTNYQFDASASGEDVRFASIGLTLTKGAGVAYTDLTSCQLFDGTTALNSTVVNPTVANAGTETFSLDNPLVIPKGTVKTIGVKCNVSSNITAGATATFYWGITSTQIGAISGTGSPSGVTVVPTGATQNGATLTVGASTLVASADASAPSYRIVNGGVSDAVVGVIKMKATNQDVTLQEVGLTLNSTYASTSDVVRVRVYDGANPVGTVTFTGSSYTATTSISGVTLTKNTDKALTIKADLQGIGLDQPGRDGSLVKVAFSGAKGSGLSSGVDVWASGSATFDGVRVFKAYPTFARISVPSTTLVAGTMDLYRFSVSASPSLSNGVGIYKFTVNVATSSGSAVSGTTTVTNMKVYAFTDSSFGTPVSGFTSGQVVATMSGVANGDNNALLSSILQIPAGSTYYFKVVGDVALTSGSGTFSGSVTTKISGDAAYPTASNFMLNAAGVDADTNDNFIWSPNATTTAAAADLDWTNGYGVSGLPSDYMDSQTLSK